MIYYVYVIKTQSKINNKFYTYVGYTNNLKLRIKKHNTNKGAKFTKGRKWKLIYYEKYTSKINAMRREYYIKNNRKLRNLIKNAQI
jgi:putative endonuclease